MFKVTVERKLSSCSVNNVLVIYSVSYLLSFQWKFTYFLDKAGAYLPSVYFLLFYGEPMNLLFKAGSDR